jgi:hypothetical protein
MPDSQRTKSNEFSTPHATANSYIIVVRAFQLHEVQGSPQIGRRWMARAAKLAVVVRRDVNPFGRAMRSTACGGM